MNKRKTIGLAWTPQVAPGLEVTVMVFPSGRVEVRVDGRRDAVYVDGKLVSGEASGVDESLEALANLY